MFSLIGVSTFSLIFTIQNVPIKFLKDFPSEIELADLQYKMFLLNALRLQLLRSALEIYNTKCSY